MADPAAVEVTSSAGIWTARGVWTILGLIITVVIGGLIKIAPRWRELGIGERRGDMQDMRGRIHALEGRLDRQERRHGLHIEIIRQLHEGEIQIMRHRLRNEQQLVLALMMAIKSAPTLEKLSEVLPDIEAMRARHEEALAAEQAEMVKLRTSALETIAKLQEATDER